jgi:hypothetical protein
MNFYIVGNSLASSYMLSATDLTYIKLLSKDYIVYEYTYPDNPIIACIVMLRKWQIEKNSIIIIHAGCAELIPHNKNEKMGWLNNIYNSINKQNIETIYFGGTIQRYKEKIGNSAYMTEDEFIESCKIARYVLDKIKSIKKIFIGINYLPKDDWRYDLMSIANKIIKDIFGDLYFIDMFKEELFHLVHEDKIHLNIDGHKYVYDEIMKYIYLE